MPVNETGYIEILKALEGRATLVAVSKTKPVEDIKALYDLGHRDFGENYVQEMVEKQSQLPGDIRWHFIGHLQSNKVKYISSFVFMIQGVDSLKLLVEINKQAKKHQRVIECLLQVHIAKEETKFGFNEQELDAAIQQYHSSGQLSNIKISGLMGMASFTDNKVQVRDEFVYLKKIYDRVKLKWGGEGFSVLSMGMSSDYQIALEEGSNMVRIGSLIFGERVYNK
ncbi:MAG TPA: YggS family pyridoxal phosphate-dependent enzyme [Puia sp.]|nr:YggS family pyridoxal phosphate-dependent enzyme [Puia sp.]